MKRIMIACAGGMSSSILVRNLVNATVNQGYKAVMKIVMSPSDYNEFDESVDLVYFVTGASAFSKGNMKRSNKKADMILIAPQVRYLIPSIKNAMAQLGVNTPVEPIDMTVYGKCNGEALFDQIREQLF